MADGLNRVMLFGNLGVDPEFRTTGGGQAVLKLRMATTESYLDRNRARQEKTDWHSVVVFGKRAEALSRILSKGSRVFVEGKLSTSSYDGPDGSKRYKTEVVASNIILGGGSRNAPAQAAEPAATGGGGFSDEEYGPRPGDDDFGF